MRLSQPVGVAYGLGELMTKKMVSTYGLAGSLINTPSSYLITRCPSGTLPKTSQDGVCSCEAQVSGGQTCVGVNERSRNAVCIEDIRSTKRQATCGLEYFEIPSRCPVSTTRIVIDPSATGKTSGPFFCQDTASVFSCGDSQLDCTRTPGTQQMECVLGGCEIVVCREGWRFKILRNGQAACVPARPLFFEN